jgi:hypothetical protein
MKQISYLRHRILQWRVNRTVIWRSQRGACELIQIFVGREENCSNQTKNIRHHCNGIWSPGRHNSQDLCSLALCHYILASNKAKYPCLSLRLLGRPRHYLVTILVCHVLYCPVIKHHTSLKKHFNYNCKIKMLNTYVLSSGSTIRFEARCYIHGLCLWPEDLSVTLYTSSDV